MSINPYLKQQFFFYIQCRICLLQPVILLLIYQLSIRSLARNHLAAMLQNKMDGDRKKGFVCDSCLSSCMCGWDVVALACVGDYD